MPVLLSSQGPRDPHRTVHHAAALVVQAQDRGHTVPAGCPFQRGGDLLGIADASGLGSGPRRKSGNKGLLLHSGLCLKRTSKIMQIPYLTPQGGFSCRFAAIHLLSLICGKDHGIAVDEGLHLHITGGHQRTSYTI